MIRFTSVVLPAPVGPTMATVSPGCATSESPSISDVSGWYENDTSRNSTRPRTGSGSVALDVSSSLIILFTIFGAFLQYSGAGKFYLDFSFSAMGGKPTGAGRTVVLASFLLGGPSGSGVATTVTLGSVAYPMLQKVGYEKNAAGGLLAAGGLGAIISPPVLGAAAFLIAEFLKISYLDVLLMAVIPTGLFYFALFLMVEIDARKYGMHEAVFEKVDSVWSLTRRYWFHFLSLVSIVAFMMLGFPPVVAVFWAHVGSPGHRRVWAQPARFPPHAMSAASAATATTIAPIRFMPVSIRLPSRPATTGYRGSNEL